LKPLVSAHRESLLRQRYVSLDDADIFLRFMRLGERISSDSFTSSQAITAGETA